MYRGYRIGHYDNRGIPPDIWIIDSRSCIRLNHGTHNQECFKNNGINGQQFRHKPLARDSQKRLPIADCRLPIADCQLPVV